MPRIPGRRGSTSWAAAALIVIVIAGLFGGCGSDGEDSGAGDTPPVTSADATTGAGTSKTSGEPAGLTVAAPTPAASTAAPAGAASSSPPPIAGTAPAPAPARELAAPAGRPFPSSAVWGALRQCQSQGDYGFVHPSGQYFGAYQFTVATWDRLAGQRYTHLLGVLPSDAAPEDQDRMAYYLWQESGPARWPACGHVFTGDPPPAEPGTVGVDPPAAATSGGSDGDEAGTDTGGETPSPTAPAGETDTGGEVLHPEDLPSLEIDPSVQPAFPPDTEGFPTPEQWEALRHCESTGNYQAVNSRRIYFGAYQFWPDTWDSLARRHWPRLVGVLPSAATPQDQTRMAYKLYEERGDQPWPVCGRYLRAGAGTGSSG